MTVETAHVFSIVFLEGINILALKSLYVTVVLYFWYHKPKEEFRPHKKKNKLQAG